MGAMNRREMCVSFAGMAAGVAAAAAATGGVTAGAQMPVAAVLAESKVYPFDQLPVRKMANGGESRDVLHGMLPTGEAVGVHESMQPAGMVPNPAHAIQHSEIIMVMEGTLEFYHDGQVERIGPGGIAFVSFGTVHQVKNVGDGALKYAIVAVGGDIKKG